MQKDSPVYIGAGLNGIFTGSSIVIKNINNEVICTIPWGAHALTANCGQNMPGVLWATNIAYTTNWHDLGIGQARIFYKPKQRQSTATYTDKDYDYWAGEVKIGESYEYNSQEMLDSVGVLTPMN